MNASELIKIFEYIQGEKQEDEVTHRILDEIDLRLNEMECTLREIKEKLETKELPF